MKLDAVINIDVPKEVILDRLTTRRTCSNPDCQEIYNIKSKTPSPDGKCLKCGSLGSSAADETVEAITKDLKHTTKRLHLLLIFMQRKAFKTIASLSSDEIVSQIKAAVKG